MELTGVIDAVLESWPLQLALRNAEGRQVAPLDEDAIVIRGVDRLSPNALRPGQRVLARLAEDGGALRILSVEILAP